MEIDHINRQMVLTDEEVVIIKKGLFGRTCFENKTIPTIDLCLEMRYNVQKLKDELEANELPIEARITEEFASIDMLIRMRLFYEENKKTK